jgi:hypothetical protein
VCTAAYRAAVLTLLLVIASEMAGTRSIISGIFLLLYKVAGAPVT